MKKYSHILAEASTKVPSPHERVTLSCELPLAELISGMRADIEAHAAEYGLKIMHHVMQEEIEKKTGAHGSQTHYRHGQQPGYVIYAGRKVSIQKPRLRHKGGEEQNLKSYQAFQQEGRMQRAVARQLIRQCSTRNYSGAIDDCLEGYGIKKSSVSRHWKVATEAQLHKLCQRPVPADLLALIIDSQHFGGECVVVALGVDPQGQKQVLGLWHGATENSTVVTGLLHDLIERGLDPSRRILVVLDGAKALRKAVETIFGDNALVQRCRVHKQRNIVEHLPKEKQKQAIWKLRGAWAKNGPAEALKELRSVGRWLDEISPGAARSLEEGLEETLTLQRLGINELVARSFSSTNLIESCFSRSRNWTARVKRWRNAKMILRWSAAALLVAEGGFRKVRGFRHIHELENALRNYSLAAQKKAA